jgi:hypothetical protein
MRLPSGEVVNFSRDFSFLPWIRGILSIYWCEEIKIWVEIERKENI